MKLVWDLKHFLLQVDYSQTPKESLITVTGCRGLGLTLPTQGFSFGHVRVITSFWISQPISWSKLTWYGCGYIEVTIFFKVKNLLYLSLSIKSILEESRIHRVSFGVWNTGLHHPLLLCLFPCHSCHRF